LAYELYAKVYLCITAIQTETGYLSLLAEIDTMSKLWKISN